GDPQREPQSLGRGVGAFGPQLQLPEERQHSDHRRADPEIRSRDAEDQELWPQVTERNQGDPGFDGSGPRHEDRRARKSRAGFGNIIVELVAVLELRHRYELLSTE